MIYPFPPTFARRQKTEDEEDSEHDFTKDHVFAAEDLSNNITTIVKSDVDGEIVMPIYSWPDFSPWDTSSSKKMLVSVRLVQIRFG